MPSGKKFILVAELHKVDNKGTKNDMYVEKIVEGSIFGMERL